MIETQATFLNPSKGLLLRLHTFLRQPYGDFALAPPDSQRWSLFHSSCSLTEVFLVGRESISAWNISGRNQLYWVAKFAHSSSCVGLFICETRSSCQRHLQSCPTYRVTGPYAGESFSVYYLSGHPSSHSTIDDHRHHQIIIHQPLELPSQLVLASIRGLCRRQAAARLHWLLSGARSSASA